LYCVLFLFLVLFSSLFCVDLIVFFLLWFTLCVRVGALFVCSIQVEFDSNIRFKFEKPVPKLFEGCSIDCGLEVCSLVHFVC
jgi:hypothetical protein